jgi:hypothetical protein
VHNAPLRIARTQQAKPHPGLSVKAIDGLESKQLKRVMRLRLHRTATFAFLVRRVLEDDR